MYVITSGGDELVYYGLIVLLDCKQAAGRSRLVVWGTYLLVEGYRGILQFFNVFTFGLLGMGVHLILDHFQNKPSFP